MKDYPSSKADKFILRMPEGWRDTIKAVATRNRRSMNSELLAQLESWVAKETEAENATT